MDENVDKAPARNEYEEINERQLVTDQQGS